MQAVSDATKKKIEELRVLRKPLFEYYEKNPTETHLVLEIKVIDDQIAEYRRRIQEEKTTRN